MAIVYLAGPIRDGDWAISDRNWRILVRKMFDRQFIKCIDPTDGKYIDENGNCRFNASEKLASDCPEKIYQLDIEAIAKSDYILVNFLQVSGYVPIGSLCEIGIGMAQKHSIVIATKRQQIIQHPFIKGCPRIRVVSCFADAIVSIETEVKENSRSLTQSYLP